MLKSQGNGSTGTYGITGSVGAIGVPGSYDSLKKYKKKLIEEYIPMVFNTPQEDLPLLLNHEDSVVIKLISMRMNKTV